MTIREATHTGASTESSLRTLVSDFNSAPLANGKKMRDLLSADFEAFRFAAVAVLRDATDVRGIRYLVTLLWTHELLIPLFGDTTLPKELSLNVAKTAAKVDPQLHIRLTKYLVSGMLEGHGIEEAAASRLLEILSVITDPASVQPFLRQMLLHPNARIRSKVTMLIGRGQAGLRALEKLLRDQDARVRANAVEAVWFITDSQALNILSESLEDTNNRVIGNAILGLYLAGETKSIPAAIRLASHPAAVFRATGAWVIGRTKDPRFVPLLGRMLVESQGQLRKTVFSALDSIKKAALARAEAPPLRVDVIDETKATETSVRLVVFVTSPLNWISPEVKPTEFVLVANANPITEYSCVELNAETILAGIVLPPRLGTTDPALGSLEHGLMKCLEAKRRTEHWGILRVIRSTKAQQMAPLHLLGQSLAARDVPKPKSATTLTFSANPSLIESAIRSFTPLSEAPCDLFDAARTIMTSSLPVRGARHLILVVDSESEINTEQRDDLLSLAVANGFCVHALSTRTDDRIASLCALTSGMFILLEPSDQVDAVLIFLYKTLRRRFVIEFGKRQFSGPLQKLTVQVHRKADSGESNWEAKPTITPVEAEQDDTSLDVA